MIKHSSPQSGIAAFGGFVATAGYDNKVILWDATNIKAIAQSTHDHLVNQVSFSRCGQFLISSSSDYSARLWTLPDLKLKAILNNHTDDIEGVAINSHEEWIATSSRDTQIHIYDFHGNLIKRLKGHTKDVISVAWLGDSDHLVSSSDDGTIKVWNVKTGLIDKDICLDGVETDTIAITPKGLIYAGNDNGEIIIIDNHVRNRVKAHDAGIKRLVYDENQHALVSLSYDRNLCIWASDSDGSLALIKRSLLPNIIWPRACTFLDSNSIAFVTFGDAYAVYNISDDKWLIDHINPTNGLNAITYRDSSIFSVGDSGSVKMNNQVICELGSLCNFIINLGPFIVAGGQSGEIYNAETGEVYYRHFSPLNCLTHFYKGDQQYAMLGTYTGEGILFKVSTSGLEFDASYTLHENAIKGLSASNTHVFSVCADASAAFFDIERFEVVKLIEKAHSKIINGCSVDDKGQFFSVGRDLKLKIWQDQVASVVDTPSCHSIKCLAATKDGHYVAIGTYTGYIGVFDIYAGEWCYWARRTKAGISSIITVEPKTFIASAYDGFTYSVRLNCEFEQWSEA